VTSSAIELDPRRLVQINHVLGPLAQCRQRPGRPTARPWRGIKSTLQNCQLPVCEASRR